MNTLRNTSPFLFRAVLAAMAFGAAVSPSAVDAAQSVRLVPNTYPTIQSAIDAAHAGDKIVVRRGTYVEQLVIGKDLEITGAGAGSTIVRAPAALVSGGAGTTAIVEIRGGATVSMSRLTVSGPGAGTCEAGALRDGILVWDSAHLELSSAAVIHIHDTPLAACFHSGHGITVGVPFESTATAIIRHTDISDYSAGGIIVFNEGSSATITDNVITGAGASTVVATSGIEVILGAVGTISHNVVSANACGSPDLGCGRDYFNEFQTAGIAAGGPGTVITHNVLSGNQVGISAFDGAELSHNTLVDNDYFGLLFDGGSVTSSHDRISGGFGGVWVVAAFADTTVVLDKLKVSGTSAAPIQTLECCGFSATITQK